MISSPIIPPQRDDSPSKEQRISVFLPIILPISCSEISMAFLDHWNTILPPPSRRLLQPCCQHSKPTIEHPLMGIPSTPGPTPFVICSADHSWLLPLSFSNWYLLCIFILELEFIHNNSPPWRGHFFSGHLSETANTFVFSLPVICIWNYAICLLALFFTRIWGPRGQELHSAPRAWDQAWHTVISNEWVKEWRNEWTPPHIDYTVFSFFTFVFCCCLFLALHLFKSLPSAKKKKKVISFFFFFSLLLSFGLDVRCCLIQKLS